MRLLHLALIAALAGCGGPGIRPGVDDAQRWRLSGKIGLRGPQLAESAYLNWRQCGAHYDMRISGPLGQTVARVDGRGERLRIQFEGREAIETDDPETLLQQQLGWSIPLRALRYWVRAEAAPGAAAESGGPAGQPASLSQFGWRIDYLAYHQGAAAVLPARLRLTGGQSLQATLLINEWLLGAAAECPP